MNANEVLPMTNDDNPWQQITKPEDDIYLDIPIAPKKHREPKVRIVTEMSINFSIYRT